MLTPQEIREKQFKTGLGYDKKDVEQFMQDVSADLEALLQENETLTKKLKDINESISYYKSIEKTLQKALFLAEKTAQDTRTTAMREAEAIEQEARTKAAMTIADSRKQVELLEHKTLNLMQQYENFKLQFENLLHTQLQMINSSSFSVNTSDFTYSEPQSSGSEADDPMNSEELQKSLAAIASEPDQELPAQEDKDQLRFQFLSDKQEKSYQTEDGFEFYDMDNDR